MVTLRTLLMAFVLAWLGGCADIHYTLRLDPEAKPNEAARVFPEGPEVPRYRYLGQLFGEDNFVSDEASMRNSGMKFLYWLVGLTGMGDDKLVLKRPQSGMTGSDGKVYVTDIANHAVFVFDEVDGKLLVWDMASTKLHFLTPIGIAEGANGNILVADAGLARIVVLDREGKPIASFGERILTRPTGLARDAKRGRIYVSDTHAHDIKVFDDGGHLVQTISRRGEGDGELNFPTHLAFDHDRLYVTDGMNARIQIFDAEGKPAGSFGQRGIYFGNMTRPKGVALDADGNIYVVESYYDYLLVFDKDGNFLMPLGGTGKDAGQFFLPSGVWTDARGRIYVADMFNGRIVMFQSLGGAR
jgi:DNA-binding beta-propeller fold protein YncE